jgi:hypothetical protein
MVPVYQAMPLLPELVWVKDGFHYRHGAPAGAFAGFIPPQTEFGLPALFGPLPAAFRLDLDRFGLDPAGLRWARFDLWIGSLEQTTKIHPPVLVASFVAR